MMNITTLSLCAGLCFSAVWVSDCTGRKAQPVVEPIVSLADSVIVPEVAYPIGIDDTTVYEFVEVMPEFPGGEAELLSWASDRVSSSIRLPCSSVSGTLRFQFIVEPNGEVSNMQLLKSPCKGNDVVLLRKLKLMPKWKPGLQDGKAVRVRLSHQMCIYLKG